MTIPSELKKNEIYPARITGYTSEGAGVCRIGERAVFVPGTIVGEEWDVRIVRSTSAAVWGRGETLCSPSPHRAEPDCPAYPRCGGCALRHMDYEEELSLKLQRVNDALHRIGKLDFSVSGILPAPESSHAIRAAIDEALKCKETGEEKTIVFGLTGTGYFDLVAYQKFNDHEMTDIIPTDEQLAASIAKLPKVSE